MESGYTRVDPNADRICEMTRPVRTGAALDLADCVRRRVRCLGLRPTSMELPQRRGTAVSFFFFFPLCICCSIVYPWLLTPSVHLSNWVRSWFVIVS